MNDNGQSNGLAILLILIMIFSNNLILMGSNSLIQLSQCKNMHMILSQSDTNPPTIGWPYPFNATYIPAICWDGAYTGQTQEVWTWTYWVNDTDGVDTVLFRFRWYYYDDNDDDWFNRSTVRVAGNINNGRYNGNLTWGVVWNWQRGSPECVNGCGTFLFKVWANDTYGNWNETPPVHYMGGYLFVNPPLLHWVLLIGRFLIVPVMAIVILIVVLRKRKHN
jgi:hypothetical protein